MKALGLAAVAAFTWACGGQDGSSAGSGAGGSEGGAAGAPATTTMTGVVREFLPNGGPAAEGVEVCVLDRDDIPCTQTSRTGEYGVDGLTQGERSGLTYARKDLLPAIALAEPAEGTNLILYNTQLPTLGIAEAVAQGGGLTWDPAQLGFAVVSVEIDVGTPLKVAGASVEVVAGTAEGVVYFDDGSLPDPSLTATSSRGLALVGATPAGTLRLRVRTPDTLCKGSPVSWHDGDGVFEVPIRAGTMTQLLVLCGPP